MTAIVKVANKIFTCPHVCAEQIRNIERPNHLLQKLFVVFCASLVFGSIVGYAALSSVTSETGVYLLCAATSDGALMSTAAFLLNLVKNV